MKNAAFAVLNVRIRRIAGSSTGAGWRADRATKTAANAAAIDQQPDPATGPAPVGCLHDPESKRSTATTNITAPSRSGVPFESDSRVSRSRRRAGSIPIAITRLTKNAQRQLVVSTSTPPSDGPVAAATAPAAAQTLSPWRASRREPLEHESERCRDQRRSAEGLDDASRDQHVRAARRARDDRPEEEQR